MRGIFGRFGGTSEGKTPVDVSPLTWSKLLGEDSKSKAGVSVNLDSALRVSTVIACVRVLAEGVAQLPLKLYREKTPGVKELATDLPLYRLLSARPNAWMTSFEFRECLTWHAVLGSNGFAVKVVVGGELRELLPVAPGAVTIHRNADWSLEYTITDSDGPIGKFTADQIFHLRGPSWNGYRGIDIIQEAREAIGLAIATEENHARLFSNGSRPSGIITVPRGLGDDAIKRLRANWSQTTQSLGNAFKSPVLDAGTTWTPTTMSGVDAQAIEARRHQIEEICRFFKVFPIMIGHSDKTATFASAEAFFSAHVLHSLMPWTNRWEQSIGRDLIPPQATGAGDVYAKFQLQALMRGDAKSRADFYTKLANVRAISPNEIRALEDMNPYAGGDEYLVPLNMGNPGGDPDDTPKEPGGEG